jgi:LTXXQ motif family protein
VLAAASAAILEETMKTIVRLALPVLALLVMAPAAQAQQGREDHHPAGQPEAQAAPAPDAAMPMPMPMQGMRMQGMQMPMQGMGGGSMDCPMMGGMKHDSGMNMGRGMNMGMPFEHVEGRIAFLQTEIGITDAQREQWNAFAVALRRNAEVHRTMHNQMMGPDAPSSQTWLQKVQQKTRMMSTHAEALKAVDTAAGPLYAVLTEDQRQKAERLLSGTMGML